MNAHIRDIDYDCVRQREKEVKHDVMAHLYAFGKAAPSAAGTIPSDRGRTTTSSGTRSSVTRTVTGSSASKERNGAVSVWSRGRWRP